MSWSVGSATVVNPRVEPATIPITIQGTGNEVFVAVLGSSDGRDYLMNTATFDGNAMTRVYGVKQDPSTGNATIDMVYYDCSGLSAGSYNFYWECTTGSPDSGANAYFLITGATKVPNLESTKNYSVGSSGVPNTSITPTKNKTLIIDAFYHQYPANLTKHASQTQLWQVTASGSDNRFGASYKVVESSGATSMSWTGNNDEYAHVVVAFNISRASNYAVIVD